MVTIWTTAPEDYDYFTTDEVDDIEGRGFLRGKVVRVVQVMDDYTAMVQIMRYMSGLHFATADEADYKDQMKG